MTRFQHILVPVDFGEAMHPAIDLAVALARKFEGQLTLVYAFDPSPFTAMAPLAPQIDVEPLIASAETELKKVLAQLRAQWPRSDSLLRRGLPCDVILEAAKQHGCDSMVIGTHGRRGMARFLLGSVAEKIVRLSSVPVLTVHPLVPTVPLAHDASAA
jgi:nucleotide-binding universal stress UspA family protein